MSYVMKQPKSIRFPDALDRRLARAAKKSNTPESDLVRVAVDRFLAEHPTTTALINAVVRARQQGAA